MCRIPPSGAQVNTWTVCRRWRIFGSVELCNTSSRSSRWRTQIASNVWMALNCLVWRRDDAELQNTTRLNSNSNRYIAFCQLYTCWLGMSSCFLNRWLSTWYQLTVVFTFEPLDSEGLPSRKLTYPPKNGILKMIFPTSPGGICIHPWRGRFVSSFLGQAHLQRARAAFLQEFRNHAVVVETEAFRQAVEVVRCHFGLTHVAFLQVIYLEYLGIMFIIYGFILLWIFFLLIKGCIRK